MRFYVKKQKKEIFINVLEPHGGLGMIVIFFERVDKDESKTKGGGGNMGHSQHNLPVLVFAKVLIGADAFFLDQPVSDPEGRALFDGIGEGEGVLFALIEFVFFRGNVRDGCGNTFSRVGYDEGGLSGGGVSRAFGLLKVEGGKVVKSQGGGVENGALVQQEGADSGSGGGFQPARFKDGKRRGVF